MATRVLSRLLCAASIVTTLLLPAHAWCAEEGLQTSPRLELLRKFEAELAQASRAYLPQEPASADASASVATILAATPVTILVVTAVDKDGHVASRAVAGDSSPAQQAAAVRAVQQAAASLIPPSGPPPGLREQPFLAVTQVALDAPTAPCAAPCPAPISTSSAKPARAPLADFEENLLAGALIAMNLRSKSTGDFANEDFMDDDWRDPVIVALLFDGTGKAIDTRLLQSSNSSIQNQVLLAIARSSGRINDAPDALRGHAFAAILRFTPPARKGPSKPRTSSDSGGIFRIYGRTDTSAIVNFRVISRGADGKQKKIFEEVPVHTSPGVDLGLASVRGILEIVGKYYSGDFSWQSARLKRAVVLSIRPQDRAQTEAFLLDEFGFREPKARPDSAITAPGEPADARNSGAAP